MSHAENPKERVPAFRRKRREAAMAAMAEEEEKREKEVVARINNIFKQGLTFEVIVSAAWDDIKYFQVKIWKKIDVDESHLRLHEIPQSIKLKKNDQKTEDEFKDELKTFLIIKVEAYVKAEKDKIKTEKTAKDKLARMLGEQTGQQLSYDIHENFVINKNAVSRSGVTPYDDLHGRKPKERRMEFGEQVFYSISKQGRAKMDVRWKMGVFLGHTATTAEHYVGTRNGDVLRCRSCI